MSTTVDDQTDNVAVYTSIAIGADGLPVISHQNITKFALRVTHCGNAACTSGNVSTTVDDPPNQVGIASSIAIGLDGLPMVVHSNQTARALRVTRCGNAACSAGNMSTTIASAGHRFVTSSMVIGADGLPVISANELQDDALLVTRCGTPKC
jgi:predicted regulator of Ras-like GTPase activity (Roadblock/LC7/MglB family)